MKNAFFTLVRAGLRQRRKLFIGEFLIMLLVICLVSASVSCKFGIERGIEKADAMDIQFTSSWLMVNIPAGETDRLKNNSEVGKVTVIHSLALHDYSGSMNFLCLASTPTADTVFMNSDCSQTVSDIPKIAPGTVYISQGYQGHKIGDVIKTKMNYDGAPEHSFTVAGYILDTCLGSYGMGTKNFIISEEDMTMLEEEAKAAASAEAEQGKENPGSWLSFSFYYVLKAEASDMSEAEFTKYINGEFPFLKTALFTNSRSYFDYVNTLIVDIIMNIMFVFALLLFIVLLIVTVHNISSSLRLDYTDIGILRSNGADRKLPMLIVCAEHLSVLTLGAISGLALSIPLSYVLSGPFQVFTAIPASPYIVWWIVLPVILIVLIISTAAILLSGRKITSVSSLSAINGGMQDVHFSALVRSKISGHFLSMSLALRQLLSASVHYAGIAVIAALLIFIMLLNGTVDSSIRSRRAMSEMGMVLADMAFVFDSKDDLSGLIEKADAIVAEYSEYQRISYCNYYAYINDEHCRWDLYNDDYAIPVHKGRAPLHDNEIAITEIMADYLSVKIGDEVTLSYGDVSVVCTVTGFSQTIYDLGQAITMNYRTAEKFGLELNKEVAYVLEDVSVRTSAYDAVLDALGDSISKSDVNEKEYVPYMEDYLGIVKIIEIVLYTTSVLICFITVSMNCSKLLIIEKRNLGIYRAMGFSVRGLRLQFAFRFLFASALGTLLGYAANFLFSEKVISLLLRSVGFSYFVSEYSFEGLLLPLAIIWIFFFVFAYLESRKVKKNEIRNLVTE